MKKTSIAASAALATAFLALGAQAAPTVAGKGAHGANGFTTNERTLWNQMGTDSGIGIVSQNFESSFDIYDAAAADDIKVPKLHKWIIDELDVAGTYFNGSGPARNENVTVYKDAHGLPGAMVADYPEAPGADNGTGSFTFMLTGQKLKLKSGTYWLSVQANMDFANGGEWGWENQTTVRANPAAWENPGGGFGVGCTTWEVETTCIPDGQGDHMFLVKGKSGIGL